MSLCDITEEWRSVIGFEEIYSVSSFGRVRREIDPRGQTIRRILKPVMTHHGYFNVTLSKKNKHYSVRVHKLVAQAFLGPRLEGMTVNHIDGVKTNNCALNLEYLTRADNVRHAFQIGLMATGDRHGSRTHPESRSGAKHWSKRKPECVARGERSGRKLHPDSYPHGEAHYNSKLSDAEVAEIRAAYVPRRVSYEALGRKFGVSGTQIMRIVKKQTRAKLAGQK